MSRKYPSRPFVGVGALILRDNEVLLVQRGSEPYRDRWSIPGGALKLGESLEDGVRREVREEAGLEVSVLGLVELFERVTRDREGEVEYHYVLADYLCEALGGELRAGDDARDAAWTPRSRIAELAMTDGTAAVIEKAFQLRDNR
jgi:ADP-ribose pyrophosphatase YjhB (NUDIX family)